MSGPPAEQNGECDCVSHFQLRVSLYICGFVCMDYVCTHALACWVHAQYRRTARMRKTGLSESESEGSTRWSLLIGRALAALN